jgi:hypothetical protein
MRRRQLVIATTAAAGVLAAGLIAVPALADSVGPFRNPSATAPAGAGYGAGGWGIRQGAGGPGLTGSGSVDPLAGLAQGTLTADQRSRLAGMAQDEKLAQDVYLALAASTGDARFTRIATAETRHLADVRALLTRYGIADPTAGEAAGAFASDQVQSLYDTLVARGSASLDAALAVGRDIENLDLKDLSTAGSGVTAQDVTTVYARLADGSRMHLRAFGG